MTLLLGIVAVFAILGTSMADEGGCAVNYDDPAPTCGDDAKTTLSGGSKGKRVEKKASASEHACVTEPGVDYPGTQGVGEFVLYCVVHEQAVERSVVCLSSSAK